MSLAIVVKGIWESPQQLSMSWAIKNWAHWMG